MFSIGEKERNRPGTGGSNRRIRRGKKVQGTKKKGPCKTRRNSTRQEHIKNVSIFMDDKGGEETRKSKKSGRQKAKGMTKARCNPNVGGGEKAGGNRQLSRAKQEDAQGGAST